MDWSNLSSPSVSSPRPPSSEHPRALAASTAKMGTSSMARASASPAIVVAETGVRSASGALWFAEAMRVHLDIDLGPHLRRKSSPPVRVKLSPVFRAQTRLPGTSVAAAKSTSAAEKSPSTSHEKAGASLPSARHLAENGPRRGQWHLERLNEALEVIARDEALAHVSRPVSVEPREDERILDVWTRHLELMIELREPLKGRERTHRQGRDHFADRAFENTPSIALHAGATGSLARRGGRTRAPPRRRVPFEKGTPRESRRGGAG